MVFDRAHFAHMTGGDAALQAEVLALFRAQAPSWIVGLDPRNEAWRAVVHTLKGSARGVGFGALAEACEAAEQANADAAAALAQVRAALETALAAAA